ncbi:TetR/AcrR family transcriptional regulator [Actinotalea fermentans]|uniref:TetR family transcriptional regulator n=1 Tax=Actinotalea fermentans TaxID=43671 RepID=A0A511YXJ6_9CELL|nr:TetR/AcrR family transcriptional regulator [Actinotalea fermentans]KGM17681.1 hypothetical protein N867_16975 [Actinotalea fermentans ATCC 43279 = JCM 9966 = DSM 3133]GEN79899.1 TetR family transcriptional regulator [Actinotalea fermentans]
MPRGDASAERVCACALDLFSRHGVAGTSLQMIADALGVAKAAVYYRYRTKDDIVRAVLAPAFDAFTTLLDEVELRPVDERAGALVDGLARQAVTHRRLYAVVLGDVSAADLGRRSPDDAAVWLRLRETLAGPAPDDVSRTRAAIFLSGLMGPAVDADVARLDDATLERAVASAGRRILGLPD